MHISSRSRNEASKDLRRGQASLRALTLAGAGAASGCQVVEGVFKAGFWVGALVVIGVIALVVFAIRSLIS
jgi:hypothetical protein